MNPSLGRDRETNPVACRLLRLNQRRQLVQQFGGTRPRELGLGRAEQTDIPYRRLAQFRIHLQYSL